jgi:serine kinase of HPr protein (carbohydrate metabolism regulator)
MTKTLRLHASCVAIDAHGVLLLGEPRAGKSDLSLRLIDRGAKLVADDQVELMRKGRKILASSPENIRGLIEVRGVGIFKTPAKQNVPVLLIVQLSQQEWIERLPQPEPYECLGVHIAQMRVCAFEYSAAIKIEMAMAALQDDSMTVGAFKE